MNFVLDLLGRRKNFHFTQSKECLLRERITNIMFKQYYQYGFWRVAGSKKTQNTISYRQQVPIIFYALIVLLAILGLVFNKLILSVLFPTLYLYNYHRL